jgi:phospholipid/cholesterol/gamma-HCH transport system substrate-binding protein
MDERVVQFRVGAMVLGTLIITAILLVMFGQMPTLGGSHYAVRVRFDKIRGISKGTPVHKNGILIGRVARVELSGEDKEVLVTLDIQADKTIYQDEKCVISPDLFFGNTAMVFEQENKPSDPHLPIEPDTIIEGRFDNGPAGLTTSMTDAVTTVRETGAALKKASEQLGAASKRVANILSTENEAKINDILDDTSASLKIMKSLLGNEENQKKLAKALDDLPKTLENMNQTFARTNEALEAFTEKKDDGETPMKRMFSVIKMAERTLHKFSEPNERGEVPVDQIAAALGNIDEITRLMRSIMERIDNGDGSLGALLKDRQLYERLDRAAGNIEKLSRELRPIVADAGVFMDKAARHPGVIVRDAVKPGVGIK